MIIYKITNKINGKSYTGKTIKSLKSRWAQHCRSVDKKKRCPILSNAIKKYGKETFSVEIIAEYGNLEDLNNAEEYYIGYFNCLSPNGYNIQIGGNDRTISDETKRKISLANTGKTHSPETKEKLSKLNLGKILSGGTREKISKVKKGQVAWNKGKINIYSKETISHLRDSSPLKKPIKDNLGNVYPSICEASRVLEIGRDSIQKNVSGVNKSAHGHIFSYVEEIR